MNKHASCNECRIPKAQLQDVGSYPLDAGTGQVGDEGETPCENLRHAVQQTADETLQESQGSAGEIGEASVEDEGGARDGYHVG